MTTVIPKKSQRQSSEFKKAHITAWKESGLSKRKYCEQQGIRISTFLGWFQQTFERAEQPEPHFVSISLEPPKSKVVPMAKSLRVEFNNGVKVILPDIKDIKDCLQMLREL